jgi:AcrR family transcriptional regulator
MPEPDNRVTSDDHSDGLGRGRGSRSQGTEDRILAAAFELIAEGYGLTDMGLTFEEIGRRSGDARTSIDYHFGSKSSRDLNTALVDRFHALLTDEADGARQLYEVGAEQWEWSLREGATQEQKGVVRGIVRAALVRNGRDFDPAQMDAEAIGRERLRYLMLALCGLPVESTGLDYAQRLRAAHEEQQELFRKSYEMFCRLSGREFVDGLERTQRAIRAYLEGVIVLRRFDAGPPDDEIVDTVLRLFLVTTKPKGGIDIAVDDQLLPPEPA